MSRRRIFAIAGLILALLAGAALWQLVLREGDGRAAHDRAVAALDKGDARTARVELLNAIRADPRSPTLRLLQARALLALEDGAGAQAELERALKLGAPRGRTRAAMAEALILQGDAEGALKQATAADADPEEAAHAQRMAARAAIMLGDLGAARAALEKAQATAPVDPETWIETARYQLSFGDQAGALVAADRAVALAPGNVRALTLRAERTREQYGLAASLPWFERALAIDPDAVPTLVEYAATLADMGRAQAMLSVTRRILGLQPGHPRALLMQAVMAARAGQDDVARALLEKTEGRLDGEPATLLLRGVLHLQSGNAVLAADSLSALVARQPDNDRARTLLGRAQFAAGDMEAASATLRPLVVRADADPYALTLAARAQEALGHGDMARDMLARAAWPVRPSAAPFVHEDDARLLANGPPTQAGTAADNIPYIRALMNDGRGAEALDRARALARANAGAPAAQIILGDALMMAGKPGDAARRYEAAANVRFSEEAALRLASAWRIAGDNGRASRAIGLFLAQNPANLPARRLAASLFMDAGDWRAARRMLEGIRGQLGDNDAMLMADLARATVESGDKGRGLAYARHAWRLMPGNPMTADIYGWALVQSGKDGQRAVDVLEQARAMAPGHPIIQLHLGQAYAAMGRRGEAKAAFAKAVAVPGFAGRRQALDASAEL